MESNERMDRLERDLERMKERHEALAQSVEYNQHQAALHEQLFAQIGLRFNQVHSEFRHIAEEFREIAMRFKDTRETIDGLARIAGLHQERLNEHEQRLDNLEPQ
jgi:chromosome segregation ATPase